MKKAKSLFILTAVLSTLLVLYGCGPKQRAAEGLLDTPESHYNQGMRKYDAGDLDAAQAQFEDALLLDKKYAPAHAGLALVFARQCATMSDIKSKEHKRLLKRADEHLDKAKGLDDKNANVWIAHIRYHTIMKIDEDWIEDCEKGLKKALKLNPRCDEAYYYMGLAYKNALEFRKSEDMLSYAVDIDGIWAEKAGEAMQTVHKIVQAQPGTRYGKTIAIQNEINRADMAVLFVEELNVVERVQRREAASTPPDLSYKAENPLEFSQDKMGSDRREILDIKGHWAESMIRDFVSTGIFEISQDQKFYPDEPVTRIEFAGAVQQLIYMITRDKTIFTKYIGEEESHIRDIRTDHPFYGAAMLAVERNIMELEKLTGSFRPDEQVSGADAVLFIRDIKNALKW